MNEPTYIDEKGRTWKKFAVDFTHELDDQLFTFDIWAIDLADALERVEFIKKNARLAHKICGEIKA